MTYFSFGAIIYSDLLFYINILFVLAHGNARLPLRKGNKLNLLLATNANAYLLASNLAHFVFCIFMIVYMRFALENQNNSHSRFVFKKFIIFVVLYLVADMASYIFDTRQFFGARFLNHVSMFASVFLTAYVGFFLNYFFDVVFHIKDNKNRRIGLYLIPAGLILLLLFINLFTGWLFAIKENNVYVRGPLSFVSFFLQYISFGVLALRAIFYKYPVRTIRYVKLRNSFIWVGALSLFFGALQIIAGGNIALQCFGITAGVFIIFSRFQDDQITNDILTGLNNRYALDTYIEDKIKDYPDGVHGGQSLYLLMMDINFFKRINDVHGHVEGDRALKIVAATLKKVGAKYKSDLFIARFGGDEFAAVFESNSERKVQLLCEEITKTLVDDSQDLSYRLAMGAGYALYTGRAMTLISLYDRADKALYEDKAKIKGDAR